MSCYFHTQFQFLLLFLYETFLYIKLSYLAYFCNICRCCHLFILPASRAAINTSGTRLKLFEIIMICPLFVCVLLRSTKLLTFLMHNIAIQFKAAFMSVPNYVTNASKAIVLSSDSLCFERFQVLLQRFRAGSRWQVMTFWDLYRVII